MSFVDRGLGKAERAEIRVSEQTFDERMRNARAGRELTVKLFSQSN